MNFSIVGRDIKITDALKKYVEEKLQRVKRHFDHIIDVHIAISVIKNRHLVDATIMINKTVINAKEETEDMYSAIDLVVNKLERQVRKYKEKITTHKFKNVNLEIEEKK